MTVLVVDTDYREPGSDVLYSTSKYYKADLVLRDVGTEFVVLKSRDAPWVRGERIKKENFIETYFVDLL